MNLYKFLYVDGCKIFIHESNVNISKSEIQRMLDDFRRVTGNLDAKVFLLQEIEGII